MNRMKLKETLLVEGKHDAMRLARLVDATILTSDGTHLNARTLRLLDHAHQHEGLIIFTDPDSPGVRLRHQLSQRYPHAKHAHLSQGEARKGRKVGLEHASDDALIEALTHLMTPSQQNSSLTMSDLIDLGLSGQAEATQLRHRLSRLLYLQEASAKTFLKQCQRKGVSREDLILALAQL